MLSRVSITFTQLSTFLAVARTGSVKAAADELYVTQPSVSAAMSALARELGVDLTERVGRTIRLTPAGEAFVPYAADVLGLVEQGRRAVHEAVDAATPEVRIAAVTTAAEYVVPALLQRFSREHPEIALTLEVGNRERVFQRLLAHDADVAIGGSPPENGRLVGKPFTPNEIVLIVPPGDEIAARKTVGFDALEERTWLLREEGSGTRALVEGLLARHGIRPRTLTLGSNGAIKQAVAMGLGISVQSLAAVDLELEAGLLLTVPLRGLPARHWYLLTSATGVHRPPVQRFLDFVTEK
jgi:LysR family transcriptional regulator, low CO2-responsive transcriptional regulator